MTTGIPNLYAKVKIDRPAGIKPVPAERSDMVKRAKTSLFGFLRSHTAPQHVGASNDARTTDTYNICTTRGA